jgi:hypothetical protein
MNLKTAIHTNKQYEPTTYTAAQLLLLALLLPPFTSQYSFQLTSGGGPLNFGLTLHTFQFLSS